MLDVVNIHKAFLPGTANEKVALSGVTLHLAAGDFCTVIGSNGAGKSTLLNVVSGRYRPDGGTVRIDGRRVDRLPDHTVARYVARVFQDPMAGTAAHMTIEENLSLAMGRGTTRGLGQGVTRAKREFLRTQLKVLEQGLEDRLTTKVGLLSGGQRQALSLVMATFGDPKVLLLDEHTAALDPQRAELITNLTRAGRREGPHDAHGHAQHGAGPAPGQPTHHDARGADHLRAERPGQGRRRRRGPHGRVRPDQGCSAVRPHPAHLKPCSAHRPDRIESGTLNSEE